MWEDWSKMRDFPTLLEKGRETNQTSNEGMVSIPPNYGCFYSLQAKEVNKANPNRSIDKFLFSCGCGCCIEIPI